MSHCIYAFLAGALVALPIVATATPAAPAASGVTLEQIMADRDWIGNPPEAGYWSYDSKSVLYRVKRDGSALYDLYQADVAGTAAHKISDADLPNASAQEGDWNRDHSMHVFVRDDNVFVRSVLTGRLRQLTRYKGHKDSPSFMADGSHVQWHEDNDIYVYDLGSGVTTEAADVRTTDDPDKAPAPQNYLQAEQPRLFDALSTKAANKQAREQQKAAQQSADPSRAPAPFYLGKGVDIAATALSPDGRWLAVVTQPKGYEQGEPGVMPNYITNSGYVETSKEHTYVGQNPPPAQQVKILDLQNHSSFDLDLAQLPGIKDDPLAKQRKEAVDWDVKHGMSKSAAEDAVKAPTIREVSVNNLAFSDDGSGLAVQFIANDFKDRWLA
ncbi:MAG TPA: S9 family peptidase, partial [Gammaproteobacteria bacterium]